MNVRFGTPVLVILILMLGVASPVFAQAEDATTPLFDVESLHIDAGSHPSQKNAPPHGAFDIAYIDPNMHWSNGLADVGSSAFPIVRKYLWMGCFEGYEFFVGYAAPPLEEDAVMSFQLLVDKSAWESASPSDRQLAMYEANIRFEASLQSLHLRGDLSIVIVGS